MKSIHSRYHLIWMATIVLASPMLAGADGNGCNPGGPVHVGSGGAGDAADGSTSCAPADCASLGATQEAKICPDGSSLARTVCATQANGRCAWDFPPCPPVASDPCAGKKCGDVCTTCLPNQPCVTIAQFCDAKGTCGGTPTCPAPGDDAGSGASDGAIGTAICCPAGWDLYSCTYPDGGAGQACHDPRLGCASSLTCGVGCDPVVGGRCP